ncbi:metal-dependent hydrolase [Limnoraphis robusta]|uniref:metal-dependent hydrolase n=1 Tax=Limnoraphis robusta TaxID=1118279 RepID=UPI002B20AFF8|nr:metal-dependent hydrolase [Limnoraphis robusta]MEA5498029.1 metal-dependent hydrolase [Limnoraphis robusta BA-68 BA1]
MMALTHCAISAAGVGFALSSTDPLVLGLAILGSQLPDLDTSTSLIGQVFFPISRWLEQKFPHRTLTHCFGATIAIAICSLPLKFHFGLKVWLALWLGHLIACFSDTFTKQGVQLFWPQPVWCVFGSNPHRRLTTGGTGEYWVLCLAVALCVLNIQLNNAGGVVMVTANSLGLRGESVSVYNSNAANKEIWANITGVFATDRSDASGKYFVVDNLGNEFVVMNDNGIYQTGADIIANKLTLTTGNAQQREIITLTFADENPIEQLSRIPQGKLIFISGQLTLDFPEDIPLEQSNQWSLSGSTIRFNYCNLEKVSELLREQYVIGTLQIKVFK